MCFQCVDNRLISSKSLVACIVPTTRSSLPKRMHVWELFNEYYGMKVSVVYFYCVQIILYITPNRAISARFGDVYQASFAESYMVQGSVLLLRDCGVSALGPVYMEKSCPW